MTTAGWIIMIASLLAVWTVALWSYRRLLGAPPKDLDKVHTHDNV